MEQRRIYVLMVVVVLLGSGVLTRLFSLQILQHGYYRDLAQNQHQLYKTLFPQRGEIFLRDLSLDRRDGEKHYYPLAINKEFQQVYLVPKDLPGEDKEELASRLSDLLGLDQEVILRRIDKPNDPYEPLKHKIDNQIAKQIRAWDIEGLSLAPETWRYYPNQSLASHLIGFVGMFQEQKIGQYGLEGYYENELKGSTGSFTGGKDTTGYGIPSLIQKMEPAQDGAQLVLTIDQNIQFKAEKELLAVVERWQAESGSIIIIDPKSGAILAMANWPAFNPNEYRKVEGIDIFLNPSTQKVYEPGSVFKPITMAIGLDSGQVTPETTYRDKGEVRIKGSVIGNVDNKAHGEQTMLQVLEKSLNTGVVFVQQEVGRNVFQEYIQKFKLNEPTGVDLVGEVGGNILNLFTGRDIDLATMSFGQGITMTPLGLITAISSIANNGKLMKPFIVERRIYPDDTEVITQPEVRVEVISPESAHTLTKMLVSVVDNGFGKPARVAGYNIAGKTGTAQIPDFEEGGYSKDDTIHSFVGFAPAFDPRFAILIKIDKPQGIRFASDSVSPVFKRLAEYLFNYLEIPPQ